MENDLTKEVCYQVINEEPEDLDKNTLEEYKQQQKDYYETLNEKQKTVHEQVFSLFKIMDNMYRSLVEKEDLKEHYSKMRLLALEAMYLCNNLKSYQEKPMIAKFVNLNDRCCKVVTDYYDLLKPDTEIVKYDYQPGEITEERIKKSM